MNIGGDYTRPVYVNGYQCWNCAQVDKAKKGVDPSDPPAGSGGPEAVPRASSPQNAGPAQAVLFGGALAGARPALGAGLQRPGDAAAAGAALDLTV